MDVYQSVRRFVYRNARPIDLARFQYHFENASPDAVIAALSAYQNEDGGFGHALEADAWNPNSSPIQTWNATEILREIGLTDAGHPIIQGILRYLESGSDFDGHVWQNVVSSNNDYPHAPWWHTQSASSSHNPYNPTACLAGFILRFAPLKSHLWQLGLRVANKACEAYLKGELFNDMHVAACYVRLYEYAEQARALDVHTLLEIKEKLIKQVKHSITVDTSTWDKGYVTKPSQFFNTRESCFYADNQTLADYECDFILQSQLPDGSWRIQWQWNEYPDEWAISKNWWKGQVAVSNLLYLKGMGSLT